MSLKPLFLIAPAIAFAFGTAALANNALTEAQLLKATQLSLQDYAANEPDMTNLVSGFKTTTTGNNATVIINMDADGMHMTAKYLCVPQDGDISCHFQQ